MFDFLEEIAAILGYLSDKKYFKCTNCGFLIRKNKKTEIKDLVNCPKCSGSNWTETNAMEEGKI